MPDVPTRKRFRGLGRDEESIVLSTKRSRVGQKQAVDKQMQQLLLVSSQPTTPSHASSEGSRGSTLALQSPAASSTEMYTCVSCLEKVSFECSRCYSRGNVDSRQCLCCQNILKGLERHSVDNPLYMKSYKKNTEPEKVEYLVGQKKRRAEKMIMITATSVPYDFQDLLGIQSSINVQATDINLATEFVTFRRFHIEEKNLNP